MSRSVPEWIGKTDDESIPPRVRLRVFDRFNGKCAFCRRTITGRLRAEYDHTEPLINGGANRENNLQLLCNECHGSKTKGEVRLKSNIARGRVKRLKLANRKRLIPGSKGSGIRRRMDGTVWRE